MLGELGSGKSIHDYFIQLYGCSGSEAGKASYSCQGPGTEEDLVTKLSGEDGYMFEMVCHNPAAPGGLQN